MQRQANAALLHPALHTSHSTLHLNSPHFSSSHLVSPRLSSSHLIPSLLTFRPSKFFSTLIRALISLSHLREVLLNSFQLFRVPESSYYQREVSCTKNIARRKPFHTEAWDTDAFTQKHLYQNTLYCKACTKHFSVLLCTTKLAQSTSQY